jgi:hypothetical protein
MANGDIIQLDTNRFAVKLLDAQSATSSGVWVEVPARYNIRSFHSTALEEGAADATVDIMVSNAATKPTDVTDDVITQTLNTTTQGATKTEAYRWVKAKKTAGTAPVATTVILEAARQS